MGPPHDEHYQKTPRTSSVREGRPSHAHAADRRRKGCHASRGAESVSLLVSVVAGRLQALATARDPRISNRRGRTLARSIPWKGFSSLLRRPGATMKCVSRAYAREYGLKFYITGRECVHGHRSRRYTSTKCCVECIAARMATDEGREASRAASRRYNQSEHGKQINRARALRRKAT